MTPKSNKILDPTIKSENKAIKADGLISKIVKDVLGGDLISTGTFKFFRYLLYLALLAFIYIANNYYAENNIRQINRLRKELKELRYEYINVKTMLMEIEKQSQIAKKLEKKGIKK
ncbi:MAG TPA: FtsL-like putative cell division protein, partial [Bacteroidales bacterium]|nr:FtsL-like putative cell division protein [Bacteroidales bacterium]